MIGVVALGIADAAGAGEYKNADALSVAQGKPKRTDCSIKEDVETKTYCFGDEAAKAEFMKDAKANVARPTPMAALQGAPICTAISPPEMIDGPRARRPSALV